MEYRNKKLEEFNEYIKGKKVAIIGIGVSNLPLLDYFYEKAAKVTVFDNKEKEEIDKSIIEKITFDEKSKQGYNNNEKYFEN